jgi:glycosyltransferase involved in cell wall biosynthesis
MKICLINNLYKPFNRGGADKIVENIAEGFKNAGHTVFSITTKPNNQPTPKTNEENIYYLNSFYYNLNKIPLFFRLFWHLSDMFSIKKCWAVKKILIKEKPDIVITHNLKGVGFLLPRAIKKLKIKHIHYLHDIQLIHPSGLIMYGEEKKIESEPAKIYSWLCKKLFNSPEIVISPSKWLLDLYEQKKFFPESKKIILSNPIFLSPEKKAEIRRPGEINKFLYVGEIEKQKGILMLVEAFSVFARKAKKNDELAIIGKGALLDEIKQISQTEKNIKILGWQNNNAVKEYMAEASVLIVPSLCYENSPTVIYEAALAGLPVIASDIGGIPELIEKFGGLLFEPGNHRDLLEKIETIQKNPELINKFRIQSHEEIKSYGVEEYLKKLLTIISPNNY